MGIRKPVNRELNVIAAICLGLFAGNRGFAQVAQPQAAQQPSAQTAAARPVGTIKSISGNTITLTNDVGVDVTVLVQDAAKLLRIAPGQKDLKDAAPIQLQDLQPGDQLRARGTRSSDGNELTADEIVSGTFRNIAGTISAIDSSAGSITVQDLVSKKIITVKITAESQLRKLPPPMAQRIAMRLKGITPEAQSSPAASGSTGPAANSEQSTKPSGSPPGGSRSGASGGMGRPGGGGGSVDLHQAISRMPAAPPADLLQAHATILCATQSAPNRMSP